MAQVDSFLDRPVTTLSGVGAQHAQKLAKLGITTIRELLLHLPRRYEDTRAVVPLRQLVPGPEVQTVRARVETISVRMSQKHQPITRAVLSDGKDNKIDAVWFNIKHLDARIPPGTELMLSGKVKVSRNGFELLAPKFERVVGQQAHVGTLAPVYAETKGIDSKWLRIAIADALPFVEGFPEVLPDSVRREHDLPKFATALRLLHAPESPNDWALGQRRIAFEEMFLLQLAAERARRRRLSVEGVVIPYDVAAARAYSAALPFPLTQDQRRSGHQILTDMEAEGSMNRLLQGDVGSGKTAVAALAIAVAHAAKSQTALMAPTEILARQHHRTLTALLEPLGIMPRLLVGSTPVRARREIIESLAAGLDTLVVGTHALIEDNLVFANLGLIVVDEQHRFGVAQRQALRRKNERAPNFLAMTATPIPRSLALTLYGDVNLSELREMPPGRTPIVTNVVPASQRNKANNFIRDQVIAGRQVFVICPLIEESDKLGVKSVTAEYERLRSDVFPELRIGLLHGRLAAPAKDEVMTTFAAGDLDILVATSVVEVGVDVPNASVMVIEGAERFGIAQLHQFRGRVGRGGHASYCLLFDSGGDDQASARLDAVASTTSGFELAELDLKLRGSGDVAGLRQHGLPEMLAADLLDVAMGQEAREAARQWLDGDPKLTAYAPLANAMNGYRAVFDLD